MPITFSKNEIYGIIILLFILLMPIGYMAIKNQENSPAKSCVIIICKTDTVVTIQGEDCRLYRTNGGSFYILASEEWNKGDTIKY